MTKVKNMMLSIVILGATCCLLLAGPAYADTTWLEKQKLTASDGAASDLFGWSVSMSGDLAIVGARRLHYGGGIGSAYIFKWDGESWVQQQKLTASDGAANDFFGQSVSISSDYAIVGASKNYHEGSSGPGSAYIFRWDGMSWVQQQKLTASDGAAGDYFGFSVSISSDYAIVGTQSSDGNGPHSGSAYIFKRDGITWVQQQKLTASDGAANDYFGHSVSISSDYAIVGASEDYLWGSSGPGSAYIFKRDGTAWVQQQKLLASDGADKDRFGNDVSISGDLAVIAAPYDDDKGSYTGSAYIFKRDGTNWVQQQKLTASDGAPWDQFGLSVSISGDYAIVGAAGDDNYTGSAYIFKWDGTAWVQRQKLTASDGAAEDYFGIAVSISGDYIIVGAYQDDDKGYLSGSAYIFGPPITVAIDIKPGNVPVAILSSATFDATTIDRSTVEFAGAHPLPNYCSQLGEIPEDVDGDGLLDVVFYFKTQDLNLSPGDAVACLTGRTFIGQEFRGCGSILRLGPVVGDLDGNGTVDFVDFAKFCSHWLEECTDLNCE